MGGVPWDRARLAPQKTSAAICFQQLTSLSDPQQLVCDTELNHNNLESTLGIVYNYKCFVTGGESTILVALGGFNTSVWNTRRRQWNPLQACHLPRDTILEVEITHECRGEGKGQHRVEAIR